MSSLTIQIWEPTCLQLPKNNCLYKLREIKYRQRIFHNAEVRESELEANYIALESLETTRFNEIEIEQIIEHTLAQLPPQCRTVFYLSRFKGMKNRENCRRT